MKFFTKVKSLVNCGQFYLFGQVLLGLNLCENFRNITIKQINYSNICYKSYINFLY